MLSGPAPISAQTTRRTVFSLTLNKPAIPEIGRISTFRIIFTSVFWAGERAWGLPPNQLITAGYDVKPEDVDRLSPLGLKHINMLGRYAFTLPDYVARGELRPLRDPSNADGDDA